MKQQRAKPHRPGALFELAVFAAPAVEPDIHRTAITRRLTPDAGPDTGKHTAARFRDFVTAFQAMSLSLTRRHARPRSHDAVHDGIVDLILHRPIRGPPARHCRVPVSLTSQGHHMGMSAARSKDDDPAQIRGASRMPIDDLWPEAARPVQAMASPKRTFVYPKTDGSGYGQPDRGNHGGKPVSSDRQRGGFVNRSDDARQRVCVGDRADHACGQEGQPGRQDV